MKAKPFNIPAPVGGLNGYDGIADMPANDAFLMDNWFPNSTTVDTRKGRVSYATGMPGPVESLEVFAGGASTKMLAFSGGNIYDVTAGGAVGAAMRTGRSSNRITSTMFSNAGGNVLICLSGADAPFRYDGTAITDLAITGLTGSQNTLICSHSFKGRLFFAQAGQLGFYYLAAGNVQGAASYFDLAEIAKNGGSLVGIASWSQESMGTGPNDYIVFMTSEGEYIMYSGTNPGGANTWSLVGRYYGPPPIGRKGWFNYRSDLFIISAEGIISLTQIRMLGEDGANTKYLSAKLGKAWTSLSGNAGTHGWTAELYSRSGMLVVNAPATSSTSGPYYQFVMNTNTNAWTRFTNQNGICWVILNSRLYFGTFDGKVMLADEGNTDDGAEIKCDCRQAYNYFDDGYGMGSVDKQFHFATFIVQSDGAPPISAELNVNFEDDEPDYAGTLTTSPNSAWDTSTWDVDGWAGEGLTQNFTVPFGKIGFTASVWLRTSLKTEPLKWYSTRIVCGKTKGIVLL
jgi:hypothetical protein